MKTLAAFAVRVARADCQTGSCRAWRYCRPEVVAANPQLSAQPGLGEVNDVMSLLRDGVSGLVLAGETAIGVNPVGCVRILRNLTEAYVLLESTV